MNKKQEIGINPLSNLHLPEGWVLGEVQDLVKIRNGYAFKSEDFNVEKGVPVIRQTNLSTDPVNFDKPKFLPEDFLENHSGYKIEKGDVLIGLSGSIGSLSTYREDFPALQNQRTGLLIENVEGSKKYVEYFLLSIKRELNEVAKGVAVQNISSKQIERWPIPIAPLEQQKRIVAEIEKQFSRLDEAVANLKRVKANIKRYKAAVLKAAVEGKLTEEWRKQHPDVEPASKILERIKTDRKERHKAQLSEWTEVVKSWELGGKKDKKPAKPRKPIDLSALSADDLGRLSALPPEWTWVKLGNCNVDVFDGPFGSNLKSSDYVEKGIRVIRLENIGELEFIDEKKTYISESKYDGLKKHTVSFGDIIFSSFIAGSTRVVSLPKQIDVAINKADCFCVRVHGETLLIRFLEMFLGTRNAYNQLAMEIHGATRPRINTTQLKECAIPLCSIAEQNAIVMEVDRKVSRLSELEKEVGANLVRAESLRQSILSKAFSRGVFNERSR
ncbi:MAG: restriction endonuclease subunit S [Bacteroidales bacterium]|nr:restriction endonuclease subunit S [Bacteroidales bacterium]